MPRCSPVGPCASGRYRWQTSLTPPWRTCAPTVTLRAYLFNDLRCAPAWLSSRHPTPPTKDLRVCSTRAVDLTDWLGCRRPGHGRRWHGRAPLGTSLGATAARAAAERTGVVLDKAALGDPASRRACAAAASPPLPVSESLHPHQRRARRRPDHRHGRRPRIERYVRRSCTPERARRARKARETGATTDASGRGDGATASSPRLLSTRSRPGCTYGKADRLDKKLTWGSTTRDPRVPGRCRRDDRQCVRHPPGRGRR